MQSKQKGDICLSQAIAHYVSLGFEVLLPLGDRRPYDLVIEDEDGKLLKVQCKYTSHRSRNGKYCVSLKVKGGNQSYHTAKQYDKSDFDILFVCTSNLNKYAIPFYIITAISELTLGDKYVGFKC